MINKSRGAALLAFALVLSLIPFSANSNSHGAGPQTPPCGIYKVKKDEVIAGVKFPKGSYQINAFGISCSKVLGKKGLFAKFLKLKDKDPLPKPWKYLSEAVGAPKFSSGPGVGFRAELISQSTPTPTQSPSPTPTSSATPSPTPTITQTQKVLTPLEKLNADIYQRYLVAEKNISPSFNFVRCPNANKKMAEITEKAYIDAYSFWVPIYKASAKVNWLLMSEKDWDCWYETTARFEGPNPISRSWNVWNKDTGILGHCKVSSTAFCGYGTGVREGGIFAQYNLFGTNYNEAPTPLTVHHETVHIYQSQLMSDNHQTDKVNTAACWFIEGQANLFGSPIANKGNPTAYRNFEISRLLKVYPKGSSYTKEEWLAVLNALKRDGDFCFKNELGYSLGWFALEWTYLNYSIEEMHNFLEKMTKGSTWEEAIQLVLKMDEETYYRKIAQYLVDEL